MARKSLLRGESHFQWRSPEVSRVENLSDIVFALVLTLAAAQSVPSSFADLANLWRDALTLAACFALILTIWHTHHVFFRRYDLQDSYTVFLNAVLLLLILIFIYPLRFMADFVITLFTGGYDDASVNEVLTFDQVKYLYLVYGIFFIGVQIVFALLYAHALRRAGDIGLDARERSFTRYEIEAALGITALTLVVIAVAFFGPEPWSAMAGMLFALIGVIAWNCGARAEGRIKPSGAGGVTPLL